MKKYELTNERIIYEGKVLHRIKALRSFNDVNKGDLGGYIEQSYNLSQEGDCWIYDDSIVCGDAIVYDNAKIRQSSIVSDFSLITNDALICDCCVISGSSEIQHNAIIINTILNDTIVGYDVVMYRGGHIE